MKSRQADAARWFATRRRGLMTLEERAAHEVWLGDKANIAAMRKLEELWAKLGVATAHFSPNSCGASLQSAHPTRRNMIAVACAVMLCVGAASYIGDHQFWATLDWTNR